MNAEKDVLVDREVGSSTSVTDQFDFDKFSVDHKLDLYAVLKNGNEDVTAMTFNSTGRFFLAAASKQIKYWEWEWESKSERSGWKSEKFSFPHHQPYLTDLQIMPQSSSDEKIVTCSSSGEVNLVSVSDSAVERKILGKHDRTATQLAILNQHTFYSCGADSVVKLFDIREADHSVKDVIRCLRHPLKKQFSSPRLSTIAVDPVNNNMFSIGGSELTLRTYDIRKCTVVSDDPVEMVWWSDLEYKNSQTADWIKRIDYSCKSELLVFREIGQVFLFEKTRSSALPSLPAVKEGKLHTKVKTYEGGRGCTGLGYSSFFGREDEYVLATTNDRYKLYIWDKKTGKPESVLENIHRQMTRIARHPSAPVLATTGDSLLIWAPI